MAEMYTKKFRLIENLESLRRDYVIPINMLDDTRDKPKPKRKVVQWDVILEDVKWTAIDMMENRKSKIAICSLISKRAKRMQS